MESLVLVPSDALEAATKIIDMAERKGVRLRLLGGLAFKKLCPSSMDPRYFRENKDIDLMGKREDSREIVKIMETLGYKPRELFNRLNMGQRLIYYDMKNRRRIDLFLDEFVMCHKFNFRENILAGTYTLPITQLLMTKLQVVEKTEKEYKDLIVAFRDFDVTLKDSIRGDEIADLCSRDWGIYTTFNKSLESLLMKTEDLDDDERAVVRSRIQKLIEMMEAAPKSFGWKMRARIGERTRWYDLPDADGDAMLQ
ncbi:MAG: nucleotidyltransferase family protein [Nitrososphaerota archaeon]|nr:nucleotidyltransferase family protein [Nitrososphaerota archaeon]MDG7023859.1 nucleotidyltransferase family protein [Nitrososphaerota archaeon]